MVRSADAIPTRLPPSAEVINLVAEHTPGSAESGPTRRVRTSWLVVGLGMSIVLMAVPTYLETSTPLLDHLPESVVWVPAVTASVGSALAGVFFGLWFEPQGSSSPSDRGGAKAALPPPPAHMVGYHSQRAAIGRVLRRFPRPGWRGVLARLRGRSVPGDAPAVIVITGGPGIGKSQLANHMAQEFGDRFPDGVRWVEMHGDASTHEASELENAADERDDSASEGRVAALLRMIRGQRDTNTATLEVPDGGRRGSRAPRTRESLLSELIEWFSDTPRTQPSQLAQTWWNLTSGKRILLVLDNATSSEKVRALLPSSPLSAVIVTSPVAFSDARLHYEEVALEGFSPYEGLELLDRIAGHTGVMDDRLREHRRRWRIVELCHGLPLALGFCGTILQQPNADRSATDAPDPSVVLLRQLENAAETPIIHDATNGFLSSFRIAFHECTARQRLLLRRMAASGFEEASAVTAAALLGVGTSEAQTLLDELATRFLLDPLGPASDGVRRYRLPELIAVSLRELDSTSFDLSPAERSAWSPERTLVATRRVLVVYCFLAESAADALNGTDDHFPQPVREDLTEVEILAVEPSAHPQQWLARDRQTLLRCLTTAETQGHVELQWRTSRAVSQMCQVLRMHWDEWERAVQSQRRAAELLGDQQRMAMALLDHSEIRANQGQYDEGARYARDAHALCVDADLDPRWRARADRALGVSLHRKGETARALVQLEEAVRVFTEHDESRWLARTQANLGDLQDHLSKYDEAEELLRRAIAQFDQARDNQQHDLAQLRLAEVLANRGQALQAWVLLQEIRGRTDTRRQSWYHARCLRALGSLDSRLLNSQCADVFAGTTQWEESMTRRAREQLGHAMETASRGRLRRRQVLTGFSPRSQIAMLEEAMSILRRIGDQWGLHWTTLTHGLLLIRMSDVVKGREQVVAAAEGFAAIGDPWWFARSHRFAAQEILTMLLRSDDGGTPSFEGYGPFGVLDLVAASPWRQGVVSEARVHAETAHDAYAEADQPVGVLLTKILLVRIDRAAGGIAPERLRGRLSAYAEQAREEGFLQVEREATKWLHWLRITSGGSMLPPNHPAP
ncbi:tetratricopeptide repeat protein [Spiractinospora alimapuensis]|uniref:tetratricopeptide repeat protein n=1 Tax=Spiractinospora alimapuensis TaxID=2820884 RepID=UPI001F37A542|nr:tetratricopeptide repeat protein [Spiractinospora alimapuensis]QVQ51698.1 tetratricopeptide repeat protein [Spiractinospora alimapuensis]